MEVMDEEEAIRHAAMSLFAYDEDIQLESALIEKWMALPMDTKQDYLAKAGTVLQAFFTAREKD